MRQVIRKESIVDQDPIGTMPNEVETRSIRDIIEADPLTYAHMTYDYALPLAWCEDFKAKTGEWPTYFVWEYPPAGQNGHIWGMPHALTERASILLAQYEESKNV